jgi:hypothetical protein
MKIVLDIHALGGVGCKFGAFPVVHLGEERTMKNAPRLLALLPMLAIVPLVGPFAADTGSLDGHPCEFCSDLVCASEDQFWWGPTWFPGATEVSYLGEEGCVSSWGSTCDGAIGCQPTEEENDQLLADAALLSAVDDEDALAAILARSPDRFAVIPDRALLVVLNPGCAIRPLVGLVALDPSWIPGVRRHVTGVLPGTAAGEPAPLVGP